MTAFNAYSLCCLLLYNILCISEQHYSLHTYACRVHGSETSFRHDALVYFFDVHTDYWKMFSTSMILFLLIPRDRVT
jgi:hypothetical protein